jgi:hypothetical protein
METGKTGMDGYRTGQRAPGCLGVSGELMVRVCRRVGVGTPRLLSSGDPPLPAGFRSLKALASAMIAMGSRRTRPIRGGRGRLSEGSFTTARGTTGLPARTGRWAVNRRCSWVPLRSRWAKPSSASLRCAPGWHRRMSSWQPINDKTMVAQKMVRSRAVNFGRPTRRRSSATLG